jgi:anti-sigma regulatory factor (Ser/Thr protein kinase)
MAPLDRAAMQPEPQIQFSFEAELAALGPASERIRCFLTEHGIGQDAIFAIETVIEEIATNAIKYGFGASRKGRITLKATATATRAELVIEDDGAAFDPTAAPDPDVHRALEEMPIGGLGIHLVRALTDGFHYERVEDRNHVHVWVNRKTA